MAVALDALDLEMADFLFSLGQLDQQRDDLDRKLGAMCARPEAAVSEMEREAV